MSKIRTFRLSTVSHAGFGGIPAGSNAVRWTRAHTKVGANPESQDDPAEVAQEGFEALMNGDERVVPGSLATKLQGRGSRFIPDRAKSAMHRRMAEPGSGDDEG